MKPRILPACAQEGIVCAFVYCRVSTQEQATDDHYSLANQEARCRDYIKQRSWQLVKVLKDVGSGKSAERPNYQERLLAIREKRVDVVVVYRLDRLSRNVVDVYNALNALSRSEVGFASVQGAFDTTTAMGRAMLGVSAVFAQLTREMISENTRDGLTRRAQSGNSKSSSSHYTEDRSTSQVARTSVRSGSSSPARSNNRRRSVTASSPRGDGTPPVAPRDVVRRAIYLPTARGRKHWLRLRGARRIQGSVLARRKEVGAGGRCLTGAARLGRIRGRRGSSEKGRSAAGAGPDCREGAAVGVAGVCAPLNGGVSHDVAAGVLHWGAVHRAGRRPGRV
ncbi:MAG: recombinase family protein [Armatimonadetes bacterium]|nr:recombinase family protein [Armatimonadota bacterium]